MWQLCVLPLDNFFKPCKDIQFFEIIMKLNRPENVDPDSMSREQLVKAQLRGVEQEIAADLFEEWVEKLNLPDGKRIAPLAHNWPFDREFLIQWMGRLRFNYLFDARFRDLMSTVLYANDRADRHVEQIPYSKLTLGSVATRLCVDNPNPHDALNDCLVTAECYGKMLSELF